MDTSIRRRTPQECYDTHDCYEAGDTDVPEDLWDLIEIGGLRICRRCGRGEAQLFESACDAD